MLSANRVCLVAPPTGERHCCEVMIRCFKHASAMAELISIELGFVEESPSWKLNSRYFPSKVGGRPAWLNLKDLPSPSEVRCHHCSKPTAFLLQIYAPVEDADACFHRTVFVFVCRDSQCCQQNKAHNFIAFRCQLPRKNCFYGYDPPKETEPNTGQCEPLTPICDVCGCQAPLRCAKCKAVSYCGKEHQIIAWKNGHKHSCGKDRNQEQVLHSSFLLPEYEIVTEMEDIEKNAEERSEAERMQSYREYIKHSLQPNEAQYSESELASMTNKEEKQFKIFKKVISAYPDQILRYQRGGTPLWIASQHMPALSDIPHCSCGAPRQFEFQIMPQLLNFLHLDEVGSSIDWGTVAIYTCSQQCENHKAYHPEFVWKQDVSKNSSTVQENTTE